MTELTEEITVFVHVHVTCSSVLSSPNSCMKVFSEGKRAGSRKCSRLKSSSTVFWRGVPVSRTLCSYQRTRGTRGELPLNCPTPNCYWWSISFMFDFQTWLYQAHKLEALQQLAVLVLQSVGLVNDNTAPLYGVELWTTPQDHLKCCNDSLELVGTSHCMSLKENREKKQNRMTSRSD